MKFRSGILIYLALFFMPGFIAMGQEKPEEDENADLFKIDTPVTIDLEDKPVEEAEVRTKKRKKNVFYGIKTKRWFTKRGTGDKVTIELFYYLKEPLTPDPYVRNIYWYDFRRKSIRNTGKVDKKYGVILHGPYKKMVGNQIVEQGIYYIGTKHGRWTNYNKHDILMDKEKYYKGWPRESLVTYHDEERKKLKEIVPVEFGVNEGNYYYFHESGNVAVAGHYKNGKKVGKWTEYYQTRGRRKKVIQYPSDPYDKEFQPYTWKEWNAAGKLVYDRDEVAKRLSGI